MKGCAALMLLLAGLLAAGQAGAAPRAGERRPAPSWGAIASGQGSWGYAFNHASQGAAEQAARAQCDRAAGRPGSCSARTSFERACGALATGNFGEWGAASAPTAAAAVQEAAAQCNAHLPTEPCKVVASTCSPR